MTRIFGLCSGDPFGARSYSGSVRQLLLALQRRGQLAGAVDVDEGHPDRGLARLRAVLETRNFRARRLQARWTTTAMEQRSQRATRMLLEALGTEEVTSVLMYGTDFFPAEQGGAAVVPVGAGLDTTFAQLARSKEDKFAYLRPAEVANCVARQREVFDRCAVVFPRTQWCADSLREDYGVAASKIVVTGAGPNLDAVPPPRGPEEVHDGRTLLFVGRDWERKHGPLVLEGFRLAQKQRPDLRLVVVGPRKRETTEAGVEWLGPLDGSARERLQQLFREASLLLCPSRFEPFGIVLLEAMITECPVVTLDRGAAREIVEDGVTGTRLREAEPRALADAVLHWLGDVERLAEAGRAGRARVLEQFSWDLAAERIASAFEPASVR